MDNFAEIRRALRLAHPRIAIKGVYWDPTAREWVRVPLEDRPVDEFAPVVEKEGVYHLWYLA